jgi:hypothetical protein
LGFRHDVTGALGLLLLLVPVRASAQGGALDYAHGVAALQAQNYENARSSCEGAARALAGDPAQVQQLGRAELCVADALVGLGQRARARETLSRAIAHLEDSGRTIERYLPDLERARAIAPSLEGRLAHVRVRIDPASACPARLSIGGVAIEGDGCDGRLHTVDAGRIALGASAESYRAATAEVDVETRAIAEVTLRLEPDPAHPRWISGALEEEGSALVYARADVCVAPCETLLDQNALASGFYVVRDEDGIHSIELGEGVPQRALFERVSDSNTAGWVALGVSPLLWAGAIGVFALGAEAGAKDAGAVAVGVGGVSLIGLGISAIVYGFIVVLTPPAPTYYRPTER